LQCEHPYLVGLTRQESDRSDGSLLSMLFRHSPRRFSFRPGQQEMLRSAISGATDEDLAVSLRVSVSAIKKRWGEVYGRVQEGDPELLPTVSPRSAAGGLRGRESRRHLLNYLRDHPEELQPNAP